MLLFCTPAAIVLVFDPFFVYHKPLFIKDLGFDGTDRYQNAGLINSWLADPDEPFDTVIIGTSMTQNFPVTAIRNEDGIHALKLTLAGGTAKEQSSVLHQALKTGRVKTVIWEVYSSFGGDDPDVMHDQSPLPLFIYNDSLLDDWRYVFNNDVVEEALKAAIGKKKKRKPLEQLYLWKNEEQFQRFNSPENVRAMKDAVRESKQNGHIPLTMSPPQDHYDFPSVEQNLMPLLEDYPDVAFTIYYPPISYYAYAAGGNDLFWQRMKLQEYVLDHTADMDNVTIYAFDLGEDFGENLANFMDPSHYSPVINERIAQSIVTGESRFLYRNPDAYSRTLAKRINLFAKSFAK